MVAAELERQGLSPLAQSDLAEQTPAMKDDDDGFNPLKSIQERHHSRLVCNSLKS